MIMLIRSSAALREDYGAISELARESGEPIYITQNGDGDIVIMDISAFERREQALRLKLRLAEAELSRLNGESAMSIDEARDYFNKRYGV
jgi:prevent-host-death family protein